MFRCPIKWVFWLINIVVIVTTSEASAEFDALESKFEAFQREQALYRSGDLERIKLLEISVSGQERSIGLANQRIKALEDKIGQIQTPTRRQINNDGRIAFSIVLDHDLDALPNATTIVFNKELYNSGSYNTDSGVFQAPVDGVYLFIYFIGNRHAREVDAGLLLNGVKQNEAVAEGVAAAHDTQGGNSAILSLNTGDRVWLATTWGDHVEGAWKFSTFTGTLLFPN